ncbi:MAG: BrnT family toxin [Candidatus Rokubacteria bacterium]|nr:BrnT family toxin [Candidatus Rokubacteria bacterium]
MRFEWDPRKADANLRAHGIGFAEAVTVLEDSFALTREDPDAVGEQRFATLGLSDQANLLVVVYAYREPDIVRMLSAWRANKRQRGLYEKARS